jgi:hypothetical protein
MKMRGYGGLSVSPRINASHSRMNLGRVRRCFWAVRKRKAFGIFLKSLKGRLPIFRLNLRIRWIIEALRLVNLAIAVMVYPKCLRR